MNFYNDIDEKACAWMRELIRSGLIPAGDVSSTSITELDPDELRRYTQVHLFCGIAGWSRALDLAGWDRDRPVWTGSCPCQPFSAAGKREGHGDERHLWPAFMRLIRECRPDTVFGEQVGAAVGLGWLDGVSADLEEAGYAFGAAVLGAHSVGAPHRRQRLYWVAHAGGERRQQERRGSSCDEGKNGREPHANNKPSGDGANCGLAHAEHDGGRADEPGRETQGRDADGRTSIWMGNATFCGDGSFNRQSRESDEPQQPVGGSDLSGFWSDSTLIPCRDGKARRVKSGLCVLAHGVPGRVGLLRGYGNAIVPQVAAEFIRAFLEVVE